MVARSQGGWFPTTWGWAAMALLFVAAAGLILLPALPLGRFDGLFLGGLAALTAWTALSWIWSESRPLTALELERTIVYAGGTLALLVVGRRRSVPAALGGLLLADVVICGHALATRLVPDHVTWPNSSVTFRLAGVFGYPNALGTAAVMGLLLALGFATDGSQTLVRAAAAAASVPLGLTLYFANSRGSWGALAVGAVAAVGISPGRRQLAAVLVSLAVVTALATWLASRSAPLTRWTDPAAAAHDGHRVLLATLLLAVAAASTTALRRRIVAAAALGAAVLAVVVAPVGSPAPARSQRNSVVVPGGAPPGVTASERLFSTTSNSRTQYWRVALRDFARHPFVGSGAGTFVREWYRHRQVRVNVTDAHSLYLETLAELGPAGLALVLFVLSMPVAAAASIRRDPFVAGVFGAFAAFLAHLAVDWDWELPAVTLAGLFCGGLLVIAARSDSRLFALDARWRTPLLAPVLALLAASFVGLVANRAEAAARAAAARGDWSSVSLEASRAGAWAPWAAQPLVLQADAASAMGDEATARLLLRRAIGKDPVDYQLWQQLASLTHGQERLRALRRAGFLDPLG